MKKLFLVLMIVVLSVTLAGCGAGMDITIEPNPMNFYSGNDQIDGTITVSVTGMGALTINRVLVEITGELDSGEIATLYSFDSDDYRDELGDTFPISIPFAFQGIPSQTFDIQADLLGDYTINDMIEELNDTPNNYDITSYADLEGKSFEMKVTIDGTPSTSCVVDVHFNSAN